MKTTFPFFTALAFLASSPLSAEPRPNIILIFADDLGYGDTGCYGGKLAPTPHIDRLAAGGVRCTDGYVTAPVCAPSRCGIMTGAYNQRFGMQWNDDRQKYVIPTAHRLMPEALRAAGYHTGQIGKWNIPRDEKATFDETYAVMDWEGDYFPGADGKYFGVDNPEQHASAKVQGVWGPERPEDEYLTDRLGRHAVEFIEKNKGRPFFLYLAFNAVHTPLHAKKSDQAHFAHIKEEPLRMYAAMVASLDENVGRVLDTLNANGLEQNTLVAFTSDNGPAKGPVKVWREEWPAEILLGSAGPLNGHKAQFLEGGFREPYILRWPAKLEAGLTYSRPVSTMDLYPTFCAAAGAPVPVGTELDGVNLLPFLSGETKADPHAILFWKNGDYGAAREGDWKLLLNPWEPRVQLFNLKDDIGESRDLATERRDVAERLRKAWADWSAELPPRANPPRAQTKAGPPPSADSEPITVTGALSFRQPMNKEGKPYKAYDVTTGDGAVYTFTGMIARQGAPSTDVAALVGHKVRVAGKCRKGQPPRSFVEVTGIERLD